MKQMIIFGGHKGMHPTQWKTLLGNHANNKVNYKCDNEWADGMWVVLFFSLNSLFPYLLARYAEEELLREKRKVTRLSRDVL